MLRIAALSLLAFPLFAQPALRPFEAEGFAALNAGDHARCSRIFAGATRVHPDEPSPPLAAARCFAGAGDAASARRYLDIALQRGYRNCRNLRQFPDALPRCEANAERFVRESNPELLAAFLADQEERSKEITDVAAARQRDAVRRDVVHIAMARRALRTADDYYHAAMILHHGSEAAAARDFAKKAVALRPSFAAARWLYAAATDRALHASGKPQIFGTQYQQVNGKWTLEPLDPDAIDDAERARWRVPPLAETRKIVDEMNRSADRP
jgi:hypothetical protein